MPKWLGPQPKIFHMESMESTWNWHGFHLECGGKVKTSIILLMLVLTYEGLPLEVIRFAGRF